MLRRLGPIALALALTLPAVATGSAGSATAPPLERVTMIGDSVATAVEQTPDARATLGQGIELDLQLAVCRRLVGGSCPYQGVSPPTLVDLLPTLRLGGTVIVAMGYNDYEATFDDAVETTLKALEKAGAEHVLWLTLRAERQSYLKMNDVITAAATRHPTLTIVDWNLYSRSHPDWFQPEGLHLTYLGAVAMATLLHKSLDDLGLVASPAAPAFSIGTRSLPAGRVGRRYTARLTTRGGVRPVTWAVASGTLTPGLVLDSGGRLAGIPALAGRRTVTVHAVDARGRSASRRIVLAVRV